MVTERRTSSAPQPGFGVNQSVTGAYRNMTNPQWKDGFVRYWAQQWALYKRLPAMNIEGSGLPGATDYVNAEGIAQTSPQTIAFLSRLSDTYQPGQDPEFDQIMPYVPPADTDYVESPEQRAARVSEQSIADNLQLQQDDRDRLLQQLEDYYNLTSAGMEQDAVQAAATIALGIDQMVQSGAAQAGSLALGQQEIVDRRTEHAIRAQADPGNFVEAEYAKRAIPSPQASQVQAYPSTGGGVNEAIQKLQNPNTAGAAAELARLRAFKPPPRAMASSGANINHIGPPSGSSAIPQTPNISATTAMPASAIGGQQSGVAGAGQQAQGSVAGMGAASYPLPPMNGMPTEEPWWKRRGWGGMPGFAYGGSTYERKFMTGERGPEVIDNPTGAPVSITPASQVSSSRPMQGAQAPGGGFFNVATSSQFPELMAGTPGNDVYAQAQVADNYGTSPGGGAGLPGGPMLNSYANEAYQNLPSLKYLQGGMPASEYNTLATGTTPGAFGTAIPEAGMINWRRASDILQDPTATAMMESLYRSASRNFMAELARARARAPIGNAQRASMIRT